MPATAPPLKLLPWLEEDMEGVEDELGWTEGTAKLSPVCCDVAVLITLVLRSEIPPVLGEDV
jgi:hypothetical protein